VDKRLNIVHSVILMNEDKIIMLLRCDKTGNVRKAEARSRNNCRGKAMRIKYSGCVSVFLS